MKYIFSLYYILYIAHIILLLWIKFISNERPSHKTTRHNRLRSHLSSVICKQHGYKKPISQIREIAGTDKQGTNALSMIEAANKLSFIAKAVKGELEHLKGDFPLPAVANVIKDNLFHIVVIHRVKNGKLLIADPVEGLETYTIEEFCMNENSKG